MIIGNKQSIIQLGLTPKIKVVNTYLKKVNKTKSLGLIIDDNLKWDDQTQYICSKVRRYIGLIEHIKHCIPKRSSILLYKSLVEPYFRYGNTVWGLCNSILIDKLQTLQNRIARMVTDTSYGEADHPVLPRELGWLSIRKLITLDLGIFMYKANKGITPDPICEIFQKASDTHRSETRYAMEDDFHKFAIKKEITKAEISHSGPKLWNNIPRLVREAPSLDLFKKRFQELIAGLNEDIFCFLGFFFFSFFLSLFSSCILVVVGGGFYFIYNDLIGSLYRFLFHILVGL